MAMVNLDEAKQSILVVIIEKANMERMVKADPITLESSQRGGIMQTPRYPDFSVLIAYEEDQDELYQRAKGDKGLFLAWLERGRIFIEGVDGKKHTYKL